jgi:flagellar basal-body rod protein FlgC
MDGISKLFAGMRAAATGLSAERIRIDVIARNIANAQTTRTPEGGPYRRQLVHFEPILRRAADGSIRAAGVRVASIQDDLRTPFERIFDPGHPDADAEGFVLMPNVNATREMADLITAVRAYEANLTVQESFLQMAERALRLAQ